MEQILFFSKKPKYKIGDVIDEVVIENVYYKFYFNCVIYKIKKYKSGWNIHIKEKI